jgi:glycosyltransferase involved in cell wall biosynthesis
MTRIVIINHYGSTTGTGMGGRHHYFARELARKGHTVTLVAARSHHLIRDDIDSEEMIDGYRFMRISTPVYTHAHDKRRVLAALTFSAKLSTLHRRLGWKPDVVLCSSPDLLSYLGAERLARSCGARLVFEVRDIWPLTLVELGGVSPKHPYIRFLQWIEDRAYTQADRVISNLKGAVEHMAGRGMDRAKFTWVPNGIAIDEVETPEPLSADVAAQIPAEGLRIVYTGTLGTANALDTLMEAAALLTDLPDIHILLIGKGREKAELEAKRDALRLTNLRFLGAIPKAQVQSALAACDVCYIGWVKSSLYQWGIAANKVPEYLFSGKPIIHAFSGSHDPVDKFKAGLSIPAESPVMLAHAIRQIYSMSESERRRIGDNGQRAALEHYDYRVIAQRLEDVLTGGEGSVDGVDAPPDGIAMCHCGEC